MASVRSKLSEANRNKLLYRPFPQKDPHVRIFCFPYAGGSTFIFRSWAHALPSTVEIMAVRLPGHDSRIRELAITEWSPLLEEVEQFISEYLDVPFVLFGHSLGASIAYELAHRIQQSPARRMLKHLIISGRHCPHGRSPYASMHALPSPAFFERLQRMKGIPADVLANRPLMAVLEPSIRADIKLAETWKGTTECLKVPMTVLSGAFDEVAPQVEVSGWVEYSNMPCSLITLPGDHFFIHTAEAMILDIVAAVVDDIEL